jgi:hypothetical protein
VKARSEMKGIIAVIAGTGFMHESFNRDDPKKFTRAWFAWANTLFSELVLTIANNSPGVLAQI